MAGVVQAPESLQDNLQRFRQVSPMFSMTCQTCASPAYYRYGFIDENPALVRQVPVRRPVPAMPASQGALSFPTHSRTGSSQSTASSGSTVARRLTCSACEGADKPCNGCLPCRRCFETQLDCIYERQAWSPTPLPSPASATAQRNSENGHMHIKVEEVDTHTNFSLRASFSGSAQGTTNSAERPQFSVGASLPSPSDSTSSSMRHQPFKTCYLCSTRRTTTWRKDAEGRAVCNACGLRLKQFEKVEMTDE